MSAACILSLPRGMTLEMAFSNPQNQRELSAGGVWPLLCYMCLPFIFKYLQLSFHS